MSSQSFTPRRLLSALGAFLLILAFTVIAPVPVSAACPIIFPYTVAAGDTADLINAIECANATPTSEVINLTKSTYVLTTVYPGTAGTPTGLPIITSVATSGALSINGDGATIMRSNAALTPPLRIFLIDDGYLFLHNVTLANGLVIGGFGGAIFNGGTLILSASRVIGNQAHVGGGIDNLLGEVSLYNSLVANNVAADSGGGIVNASGTLNVINSTISGNSANGSGALDGGGGIYSFWAAPGPQPEPFVNVHNSTIAYNTAVAPNAAKSGYWQADGTAFFANTIIAHNNGANNCTISAGTWTFTATNIDNGTSCGFSGTYGQNTDPMIGALGDNGGLSLTHALLPGSPAINYGDNAWAVDENGTPMTTDQRSTGYPRIIGAAVDAGAYESQCGGTSPYTVSAGSTPQLIEAITCANLTPTNDVINLTNSTYTLSAIHSSSSGLPPIVTTATGGTLTINGDGATIERSFAGGTPQFRLFTINNGANLTLNTLTLTNGSLSGGSGGAVHNSGTLRLVASTVTANTAAGGGGAFNSGGGVMTLRDSVVANNVATNFGGGIANAGAMLNVINSTVSGNSANGGGASGGGGAIDSYGAAPVVNFYSSTIAFNTAAAPNALKSGFWQETGTAFFANTIIANNNGANNCSFTGGTRTSIPNNIDNGTTCGFTGAVGQNTNPLLGALGNNGGPTQTHLPANTSPAVNAGDNAWAVDEANVRLSTDQRRAGYPRINSGTVDIGAVEVILPTNNTLQATLLLQGRTNPVPHPSYVIAARVRVMPAGGGSPFIDQVLISDSNGIATLSNVPLGTYLFSFKGSHTLARQVTITIAAGTNSHTTEVLLEGDATDNNTVNISDFSLLAAAFGSVQGGGTYDARTDFNGDNAITISDFSLLAANFSQTGAGGVTP